MKPRATLFHACVVACAAALVVLCLVAHRRGVRALDDELRAESSRRAALFARLFESELRAREADLDALADDPRLQDFVSRADMSKAVGEIGEADAGEALRVVVAPAFARGGDAVASISIDDPPRQRVRFERQRASGGIVVRVNDAATLAPNLELGIASAASAGGREISTGGFIPQGEIFYVAQLKRASGAGRSGALVGELKLDELCERAAESLTDVTQSQSAAQLIALDRAGRIVYHTNDALRFRSVSDASPYFVAVASQMTLGQAGEGEYQDADNARWLAAYAPVRSFGLSVAVAVNETAASAPLRREGRLYVALSALLGLAFVVGVFVREARARRRIERIARAARAVAEGDLDQRLDVGEYERARVLAESFNLMTERLREHIRREAEGRQFQAFMRLSAMLTHDLKNAITGLSMLVANMERRWEQEEFRADAIDSLREATEKLRGIVARLSKPVETLSGEYRNALKPVDLSAVVRRVVEATAGRSSFHEVEMQLPEGLEVIADVERLERVFENLVINALEAMGASAGRLSVEGGHEGDGDVFVVVSDTGAGMTPEFMRAKLFRPFATTKKQGLGLGLYTCREVVEAHGGRIEVESKPSSGTRFRVVLPSRPASLPRE